MLDRLRSVLEDRSPESRDTLLSLLGGMLFDGRTAADQEVAIFADIATRLLPQAGIQARAGVATRLADRRNLPKGMVLALASDVIVVASPMLKSSQDLTEDDLADLALRLDDEHRLAIAGRESLSFRITDVLVARGDILVLRAVAENPGAELSVGSAHTLVDRAAADDELCRILALRGDLPADDAERLVLLVAKRLRGRMARRAPESAMAPVPVEIQAAPAAVLPPMPDRPIEIQKLVHDVKHGVRTLDEAVLLLAPADRYNDLATLLATVTAIDELSVLKVLVRADANGIINVMRGLEIGEEAWAQVVKLRQRRLRFSDAQARFERDDFHNMPVAKAKQTLSQFSHRRHAG
jgi:hypothetical protein